ncbi:MAG: hypothetical protein GX977_03000 [Firmicutes bacterium]|nr:hypothetical protein [Bacillota bacterium]
MNIIPNDVLRQKRLQKTISNTTTDPVIELIAARLRDTTDRRLVDWESMTSEQQELYAAAFWDAVPVIRQLLQQELVQWQEMLNAYLWWRGDLV